MRSAQPLPKILLVEDEFAAAEAIGYLLQMNGFQVVNASNFTMYRITLQNSPMFHVKLGSAGFVVWGVKIKTPSKPTNSAGTALTYSNAHNTDGIDPGQAASIAERLLACVAH